MSNEESRIGRRAAVGVTNMTDNNNRPSILEVKSDEPARRASRGGRLVASLLASYASAMALSSALPLGTLVGLGALYSPKASALLAACLPPPPPGIMPGDPFAPGSAFCKTQAAQICATDPSSQTCYLETQYSQGIVCTDYTGHRELQRQQSQLR